MRRDDHSDGEQRIIKLREQRKLRHHAKLAEATPDSTVVPFVLDALGAFGAGADSLLQWLAGCSRERIIPRCRPSSTWRLRTWPLPYSAAMLLMASSLPRIRSLLSGRCPRA